MKTTIDHLLAPRFEVIADYPDQILEKNQVVRGLVNYVTGTVKVNLTEYPHLFRPLNWWEKRTEDEMPKYLKIGLGIELPTIKFDYYEVHKWHMNKLFAQVDLNRMSGCDLTAWKPEYTYQPCSETEYLQNQ